MLKKFFSDFKEFAMKGNVIDMALGVVIGSAFGKIVSSFVADVITPFISLITGNVNLTDLKAVLRPAELNEAGEVVRAEVALTYGNFLQCIIDFFVIALSLFLFLRLPQQFQHFSYSFSCFSIPVGNAIEIYPF